MTTRASDSTSPRFFVSSLMSIDPFLPSFADSRAGFGFHLPRPLGLPFIVQFLAFSDGQFHLDVALFEIHFGGNQRETLFARLSKQFVDLTPVQQQFAPAGGRVILAISVGI